MADGYKQIVTEYKIIEVKGNFALAEINLITGRLKINPEKSDDPVYVNRDDVKVIKDSEIKLNRDEINALKELEDK